MLGDGKSCLLCVVLLMVKEGEGKRKTAEIVDCEKILGGAAHFSRWQSLDPAAWHPSLGCRPGVLVALVVPGRPKLGRD